MALSFLTNLSPGSTVVGTQSMWNLKEQLKVAGWTITFSSDGISTLTPWSGDNLTTYLSGNGGFSNTNAWFVAKQPGSNRSICVQRTSTDASFRIKYSVSGLFNSGATQTRVPAASDEIVVFGSGTDASPTFATLFVDTGVRTHIMVDSVGLGFYMICVPIGGGAPHSCFYLDPMVNGPAGDLDPYVVYCWSASGTAGVLGLPNSSLVSMTGPFTSSTTPGGSGAAAPWCWYRKTFADQQFAVTVPLYPGCFINGFSINGYVPVLGGRESQGLGTNTNTLRDDFFPIIYGRSAILGGAGGYKGQSSYFKWITTNRNTGQLYTVTTTDDFCVFGLIAAPWNGAQIIL